jgi:hypothetical protein
MPHYVTNTVKARGSYEMSSSLWLLWQDTGITKIQNINLCLKNENQIE